MTARDVEAYLQATDDTHFSTHAAAMELALGVRIAPPTILDRDLGTRLRYSRYVSGGYALHARQAFTWHRPIEPDVEYRITGEIVDIFSRNEVDYTKLESRAERTDNGEVVMECETDNAFRFPDNQYRKRPQVNPTSGLSSYLKEHGANWHAYFPAVGSVLEGSPRKYTRELMALYSGPGGGHTSKRAAQRHGHPDSFVQGVSVTELEVELYREAFGAAWYAGGRINSTFTEPMLAESELTAIGIVVESTDQRIGFRSAVFNQHQQIVCAGSVSVPLISS